MNQTLDILVRVRGNVQEGVNALRSFMDTLGGVGSAINKTFGSFGNIGSAFANQITAPARTAASVLQQTFVGAQQSASSFLGTLVETGRGISYLKVLASTVTGVAQSFVASNIQMETFMTRYEALLKSADAAQARIAELQQLNLKSPFELPDLIAADLALQSSGKRTKELVQDVSNAAAALGGTRFEITEIAQAVSRLGAGDFGDAFERLRDLNVANKAELSGKGIVFDAQGSYKGSAEAALTAVQEIMREKFGNAAELASQTWTGIASNIADRWGALRLIMGQPLFGTLKGEMQKILDVMNNPMWDAWAGFIGIGINNAAQMAISALTGLANVISGAVTGAFGALQSSTGGLLSLLGAIITAVAPLGQAIQAVFRGDLSAAAGFAGQFVDNVAASMISGFATLAGELYQGGLNVINSFANGILSGASNAVMAAINYVTSLIASFLRGFSPPKEGPLSTIDTWFPNVLNAYLGSWGKADWGILDDLTGRIASTFEGLVEAGHMSAEEAVNAVVGSNGSQGLNQLVAGALDDIVMNGAVSLSNWTQIQNLLENTNGELLAAIESQLVNAQLNQELGYLEAQLAGLDSAESRDALKESIDAAKDAIGKARDNKSRKAAKEQLALLKLEEKRRKDATKELKEQITAIKNQQSANNEYLEGLDTVNKLREREAGFLDAIAAKIDKLASSGGGGGGASEQLDRNAEAAWRYNYAIADNATKLGMLKDKLAGVEKGSVEYYSILTDIHQLEEQMGNEATQTAEAQERLAKARIEAAWDYSYAIGDNETKLGMLREKLAGVEEGSVEYYQILGQIHSLEGTMDNERLQAASKIEAEAKSRNDAEFQYQMKLADTAGKLGLLREKLGTVEEGSAEYYNILGQIHDLEQQAIKASEKKGAAAKGAGGAGVAAAASMGAATADLATGVSSVTKALDGGKAKWREVNDEVDKGKKRFEDFKTKADAAVEVFRSSTNPIANFFSNALAALRRFGDELKPIFNLYNQLAAAPILKGPDAFKTGPMTEMTADIVPKLSFKNIDDTEMVLFKEKVKESFKSAFSAANFEEIFFNFGRMIGNEVEKLNVGQIIRGALVAGGLLAVAPIFLTAFAAIPVILAGMLGPLGFLLGPLKLLVAPLNMLSGLFAFLGRIMFGFIGTAIRLGGVLLNVLGPIIAMTGPIGVIIAIIALLVAAFFALESAGVDVRATLQNVGQFIGTAFIAGLETVNAFLTTFLPKLVMQLRRAIPRVLVVMASWTRAIGDFVLKALPLVFKTLSLLIQNILNFISTSALSIGNGIGLWAKQLGNFAVKAIPLVLNGLAGLLMQIGNWIVQQGPRLLYMFGQWGFQAIQWVIDVAPTVLSALTGFIDTLLTWIIENAPKLAANLLTWATKFWEWIEPQIPVMLEKLGALAVQLLTWLGEKAVQIGLTLLQWGIQFLEWIGPQIPGMLVKLGELWIALYTWIGEKLLELGPKLLEWGKQFYEWIGPQVAPMLLKLGELMLELLGWIGDRAGELGTKLLEWGGQFLKWIGDVLPKLPVELVKLSFAILTWITTTALDIAGAILTWAVSALAWIAEVIIKLPENIGKIWTAVSDWFGETGPKVGTKVLEWVGEFFKWVVDVIKGIPAKLGEIVTAIGDEIGKFGTIVFDKMKEVGGEIVAGLVEGVKNIGKAMYDATIGPMVDTVGDIATYFGIESPSTYMRDNIGAPLMQGVKGGIDQEAPGMQSAWSSAFNPLLGVVDGVKAPLNASIVDTANAMATGVAPIFAQLNTDTGTQFATMNTAVQGTMLGLQTGLALSGSAIQTSLTTSASTTSSTLLQTYTTMKDSATALVSGLKDNVSGLSTGFSTAGASVGKAIVDGMASGINERAAAAGRAAAQAASAAVAAAKAALGIASPSQVMRYEVGNPIVDGMALGMSEREGMLQSTMRDIANPLVNVVDDLALPMQQGITNAVNGVNDAAIPLFTDLQDKVAMQLQLLKDNGVISIGLLKEGLVAGSEEAKAAVINSTELMGETTVRKLGEMKDASIETMGELAAGATTAADAMNTNVSTAADSTTTSVVGAAGIMSAEALASYTEMANKALATVTELSSRIEGLKPQFLEAGTSIGLALMDGIMVGLDRALNEVLVKVRDMGMSLVDALKDVLGIASPSKVAMDEIGRPFTQGVAVGVTREFGTLAATLNPLRDTLLNPLSTIGKEAQALMRGANGQINQSPLEFAVASKQLGLNGGIGLPSIERNVNFAITTDMPAAELEAKMKVLLEQDRAAMIRDLSKLLG